MLCYGPGWPAGQLQSKLQYCLVLLEQLQALENLVAHTKRSVAVAGVAIWLRCFLA